MANEVYNEEYITRYEKKALDTFLVLKSASRIFTGGPKVIPLDFQDSRYVKVMDLRTGGLFDYGRVNQEGYPSGNGYMHFEGGDQPDGYHKTAWQNRWKLYELQWDRGCQILIDYATNAQEANLILGNVSQTLYETQVVPEIDTCVFSKVAEAANPNLGNLITQDLTGESDILGDFINAFAHLTELGVEEEDQVIVVTPEIFSYIQNSDRLVRYLTVDKETRGNNVNLKIYRFNGHEITIAPSNRFYTNALAGDGGVYPTESSVSINYVIADRRSIVPYQMIRRAKLFDREVVQDFDGYKFNFRLYHGVIIPENKRPGIYVSVASTLKTSSKRVVAPFLATGQTTNGYVVTGYNTNPAGLAGDLYWSATALNIGDNAPASTNKITINKEIVDATNSSVFFGLADLTTKKIIAATTAAVTLPKKKA